MITKIKAIVLAYLRNYAHFQFMLDVIAIIQEFDPRRLNIVALFDALKAAVTREDDVLKKIVKSEHTKKIKEADKARDKAFTAIGGVVRTMLKHHNTAVVNAAERLKIVLNTFGKKLTRLPYDEQTSAIYNILQEFRGEYAPDVELLRIVEMVDELERTNLALDALIKLRFDETAHKDPTTMKTVRADSDAAYHAITNRIDAFVEVEGEENYAAFIAKLNLLIDRYKTMIARTHHHAKKEEPAAGKAKANAKPEAKAGAKAAAKAAQKAKPEAKAKPKTKTAAKSKAKENKE